MTPSDVETAILELFADCHPPLRRYVGSLGLDTSDSEDVVQDVFLSLSRHLTRGRPRTNLRGWLFTVARNLALKHRARLRRRRAAVNGDVASAAEPIDPAVGPEEDLARRQRQQRLLAVLRSLPARDRRCLALRAEGLRYRDIAEATGLSLGAVSNAIARSTARLMNADDASL
ncbi:MAG TPA: sigma-70 family RNA polymerase sigma factor [Vicinamibacterales bacterium]|nr:sigma-70 family RNA polymerase sigma factor [Vicinamibacterales bacterium]